MFPYFGVTTGLSVLEAGGFSGAAGAKVASGSTGTAVTTGTTGTAGTAGTKESGSATPPAGVACAGLKGLSEGNPSDDLQETAKIPTKLKQEPKTIL